jgi:activator of HSP90 ATPase
MSPIQFNSTRRRALNGIAVALGGLAVSPRLRGQQPEIHEVPPTAANKTRTALHQEIDFKAPPARIYEILLDGKQFAAFTGMPAEIDPKVGGAFKAFGGLIEGRNVELIEGKRVVQAWRPANFEPGVYTLVHFELVSFGAGARVVLDHTGFPEGHYDSFYAGWPERYWNPLKKYLG